MTVEHIELSLRSVTEIVFPFRALEIQKQWMTRHFKKPFGLSAKKTAAGISRLNNYLPYFPLATAASKFSETELIALLEVALPASWRKTMDLKGFIPANNDFKKLLGEMEVIERNETPVKQDRDDEDDNKKEKKVKFAKNEKRAKKNGPEIRAEAGANPARKYRCDECGPNRSHNTDRCWKRNKPDKAPFSKRTFRKEVNAMARRASKNNGLKIFEAAAKREQAKVARQAEQKKKKRAAKARSKKDDTSDDSDTSSDESMHNMEDKIPRKKRYRKKKAQRNVRYNSRAEIVHVEDSEEESEVEEGELVKRNPKKKKKTAPASDSDSSDDSSGNHGTSAEEKAFLRAIRKEEQRAANNSDESD
jgi:hypothetical protein